MPAAEAAWGTPPVGTGQSTGTFTAIGESSTGNARAHPAQAYAGIGNPAAHRAYLVRIAKHALAGRAAILEAEALLRRSIKRADQLTTSQKALASFRLRRAHVKLAAAEATVAKRAASAAKVRAEVNQTILSAKRRQKHGGAFTAQ